MYKLVYEKIRKLIDGKNESYSILAKFLINYDDVESLKIKDLQNECHVSGTTVIRFCKEVGCDGFSQLRFSLTQEKERQSKSLRRDNDKLSKLANEHLNDITSSFIETRNLLTDEILMKVVSLIYNSKIVNVYALGGTYLVARDLELKLDRIKKYCKAYNDKNLQFFSAKNSDKDTVSIGITYSGNSKSVIESLEIAKEQGAKTILITNSQNTYFYDNFDVVLYVSSTDLRNRLITTTSRIALLYIIDLIYYTYLNMNIDEINSILKNNSYM